MCLRRCTPVDTNVGLGKILKAVEMLGFDEVFDISPPYCDIASAIIKSTTCKGKR